MVNFNFSLRKSDAYRTSSFLAPSGHSGTRQTAANGPPSKRQTTGATVVVSRPCGMPKQTVTTRVKSTKLTDQHRWVEILFRFLPAAFFACGQVTGLFCWVFLCLALDCIVLWEFEILYRAELSNPARNCHIFPDFLLLTFGPAVGVRAV